MRTTTVLLLLLGGALTLGAATSLGVGANDLGAGGDALTSCDQEIEVGYERDPTDPGVVTGLLVSGVSRIACSGQTLSWAILDADGDRLAADSAPVRGTDVRIVLAAPIPAEAIHGVTITISG